MVGLVGVCERGGSPPSPLVEFIVLFSLKQLMGRAGGSGYPGKSQCYATSMMLSLVVAIVVPSRGVTEETLPIPGPRRSRSFASRIYSVLCTVKKWVGYEARRLGDALGKASGRS